MIDKSSESESSSEWFELTGFFQSKLKLTAIFVRIRHLSVLFYNTYLLF